MERKCLSCGETIEQTPKKKEKIFCNSGCRSNYWQKSKKLESQGLSVDEIIKEIKYSAKKQKTIIQNLNNTTNEKKPPEQPKTNYSISTEEEKPSGLNWKQEIEWYRSHKKQK